MEKTLDPKEEVQDVVRINRVCGSNIPMHQCRRRATMEKLVRLVEFNREPEKAERAPPLDIILHEDLMLVAWSWDRLLPWRSGYVSFKDYLAYLKKYLRQNPDDTSACAAAKRCLAEEKRLSDTVAEHAVLDKKLKSIHADDRLRLEIVEKATSTIDSGRGSALAAACFMCVAEEAAFMSEWLTSCGLTDVESMAKSWQWWSDTGYEVQKVALDILTAYKGDNTDEVVASLLGMKKEAIIARELLKLDYADCEEIEDLCVDLRWGLLDLLGRFLKKAVKDPVHRQAQGMDVAAD